MADDEMLDAQIDSILSQKRTDDIMAAVKQIEGVSEDTEEIARLKVINRTDRMARLTKMDRTPLLILEHEYRLIGQALVTLRDIQTRNDG